VRAAFGARRRTSDGGGDSAALAEPATATSNFRAASRPERPILSGEAVPRKAGAGASQTLRGGGQLLLELGMFFWRAGVLLDNCGSICRRQLPCWRPARFGSRQFAARLARAFPLCDNISIDYAVMEKAGNVRGIAAADFGWNDVGSWNAVYELLPAMATATWWPRVGLPGRATQLRRRPRQMVALVGVDDLIVIDTPTLCLWRAATWRSKSETWSRLSSAGSAKICCRVVQCPTCGKWKLVAPFPLVQARAEAALTRQPARLAPTA